MHFKDKYDFLSNFYPCIIETKKHSFPTVEHAYQAAKTRNLDEKLLISRAVTPGKAKKIGRKLTIRLDWETIKVPIMTKYLFMKFRQSCSLRDKLLKINGDIIEHNYWHDNFWGSCVCEICSSKKSFNILGRILMIVRDTLW